MSIVLPIDRCGKPPERQKPLEHFAGAAFAALAGFVKRPQAGPSNWRYVLKTTLSVKPAKGKGPADFPLANSETCADCENDNSASR